MARKDRTLGLKLRAIDKMSKTIDRIQRKFPKLSRSIKRASAVSRIFNSQTKNMRKALTKIGGRLKSFGQGMSTFVTLPILAAGAAGVKMFGDFQQGLRGIEKTTGLSREAVRKLGKTFDQLSTEIPVSTREMLELTKAGGQLGVTGSSNLEKFTITMAKLGRATDVTGEEGAKSIARILTVTNTGIGDIDRFASALVDLGNNAAASEQEILTVAIRVAGQIGRFDVASDKVLGIATALKALGKRAEAAGSVIGRAFDAIDQSIKGGGKVADFLGRLTGIATKDLKQAFEKDATAVFQKFIIGLNKVKAAGGNQIAVMNTLGLSGVRINDILLTLAESPEVLAINLNRATKAFKENIALNKEFAIQIDSLNSSFKTIMNTFTSVLRMIGADLAPAVLFLGNIFKSMFNFLRNNPTIRRLVIVFAALAAVVGPLLFVFGAFLVILPALSAGMLALSVASFPITGTMFLIAAGVVAVITVITILITKWDAIVNFFKTNPFGQAASFLFEALVNPIGSAVNGVERLITAFKNLRSIKGFVRDVLPGFAGNALFGEKKLGPPGGARKQLQGLGQGPLRAEPVNGQIGVTFENAPAGTRVRAKTSGPLDFDLGFAGGLL